MRLEKERKPAEITQEGNEERGTSKAGEGKDGNEDKEKRGTEGKTERHPGREMRDIMDRAYETDPEEWDECTFPLGYAGTCCMIAAATKRIKETTEDMGERIERDVIEKYLSTSSAEEIIQIIQGGKEIEMIRNRGGHGIRYCGRRGVLRVFGTTRRTRNTNDIQIYLV